MKKILILLASVYVLICGAAGLTACADRAGYSVACQTCENGCVIVSDAKAEAGEKVILAAHPNAGYKLTTFLLDGEVLDGVSFVMPEKDVTVSARFEAVTYSITYVSGEASVAGNNPESYTVERAPALTAPEKEGYEICGWYRYCTEAEYDWNIEEYRVTSLEGLFGNLTLYAKYYNPPHEITCIDSENGWFYVEDYGYEAYYGERYNIIVNPDTGYDLDGLFVNGEPIEENSFTMPAGDAEITAIFKPVRYAVTYELDGGINSPNNPASYTVEDGFIKFEDAEKEGYIFCGWYSDEELTQPIYGELNVYDYLDSPLKLYAYFIAEDELD